MVLSLLLSCSAAVTHDLFLHKIENTIVIKLTTIMVTLCALFWALLNNQSVFSLVVMAWSGLASAFAPLLIVLCLGGQPGQTLCITAVGVGLVTALIWHHAVYEGMAGILAGLIVLLWPIAKNRQIQLLIKN